MTSVALPCDDKRNVLGDVPGKSAVRNPRFSRDVGTWRLPVGERPSGAWERSTSAPNQSSGRTPVDRIDVTGAGQLPGDLRGAIAALGNFDGLHLGHQEVIGRAVALARQRGVAAVVATFDPHPVRHFKPNCAGFALTTFDQRRRMLSGMGIDAVIAFAFDADLAKVTPAQFVHGYLGELGGVVTGTGFAFGHRRSGCVEVLAGLARDRSIASDAVGPVLLGSEMVSSTRVRTALRAGNCAEAARLLTRPFAVEGLIRSGQRPDRVGGPSRASLELDDYLQPRSGTYAVRAWTDDGGSLRGTARLDAPSESNPQPKLELFIIGLAEPDVGRRLIVELMNRQCDAAERGDEHPRHLRASAPTRNPPL